MENKKKAVENTIPILGVCNLQQSIEFYTTQLGFVLDWGGEEKSAVCSVSRDGWRIMLMAGVPENKASWVWIGLEDDRLFEEYIKRGVPVHKSPRNMSWAYEMQIRDPDGNTLWLGAGAREDIPVEEPSS